MSFAPRTIPFNIIDRSYLIPESDEVDSKFFPMSILMIVKLKEAVSQERIVFALEQLSTKYPQLRLTYKLDYQNVCWERVADADIADFIADCVHIVSDKPSIESFVANALSDNHEPLSQALNVFIADNYLVLKMHHSFGDGKFMYLLMSLLLSELYDIPIENSKLSNSWWKPVWRVIWQDIGQGSYVLSQFVKSVFNYYQDYQQETQDKSDNNRSPIRSGSAMGVRFKTISADCLALLNEMKQNISLNTVLQIMIGEYLRQAGFQNSPVTYTIPVDLRRYFADADVFYPSNLASQIRVTLADEESLSEQCVKLQQQISEKLASKAALVAIPGEWLLAMSGKKTYQSVNRDWLLKSTYNDPRVFVLSNLGKLETFFSSLEDILADDFAPQLAIPLMGSPSLVFSFSSFRTRGNITLTYDPQLFSSTQIDDILSMFDSPQLLSFLKKLAG